MPGASLAHLSHDHLKANTRFSPQADRNGEEKCRLKTVELGGLRPMVELTKSEELDVAGKAAFCLACHALDSPVGRRGDLSLSHVRSYCIAFSARFYSCLPIFLMSRAAVWMEGFAGEACDQDAGRGAPAPEPPQNRRRCRREFRGPRPFNRASGALPARGTETEVWE